MPLRTVWRRIRHLESLVAETARRDRTKRRMRTLDSALTLSESSASGSAARAVLDAPLPFRARDLPVRAVPLRSSQEHAHELLGHVREALGAEGITAVAVRSPTAASAVLGVRREDWGRAAAVLTRDLDHVLLGSGDAAAGCAVYSAAPPTEDVEGASTLHLLAPAVTLHEGRVIARYGFETAVRLERWDRADGGRFTAAVWNKFTELLEEEAFQPATAAADLPAPPGVPSATPSPALGTTAQDALAPLQQTALLEVGFPIDVVYTWVDGTDPDWLARKRTALEADTGHGMTEHAAADLRFVAHDELRHSLRSLERYAPWVRHVYLVTDRQRPTWLRTDHPRLTVVDHADIAPAGTRLPTFNSQAIEANLHRIEGLSEHFLYFNDDVFLSSPVAPELFFNPNGIASMYMSRAHVAPGAPVDGEPASDSAGKNARSLVREATGRRVSRKLFHTPFALRRSVSAEIEERWPEVVAATRDAQFRRIEDVTLSGALHMNYAFATGRAVTRGIRYRYVNVGTPDAAERLAGLEQDRDVLQTFCLNESTQEIDPAVIDSQVRSFLRRRFPDVSSFEIPGVA